MAAVVQADAANELPLGVEPLARPVVRGAVRAAYGLLPVGPAALVHGLDVDLPLRAAAPTVTTVHDLSVFDVPWAHPRHRVLGERRLVGRAINSADAVIAVSTFTAERIRHHFGRTATVIPLAPSMGDTPPATSAEIDSIRRRHGLPDRFVLHVGTIEPRKDGVMLAAACRRLRIPLVMAGACGADPAPPGVRHLGYVPADDLPLLYDAADIVAYISRYEGFGLPPVEAMARSRAVVATAVGALPDVVQDGAALVGRNDDEALVATLRALWHDTEARADLGARGREVANSMTWSAAAAATVDVYRSLGVNP